MQASVRRPLNDMLASFFSAAINLILHNRRVYPAEAFEKRRLFDVPIHVSRHPELTEYIELAVRGACELVARGEARSLVVLVLGPTPGAGHIPPPVLERFVFDVQLLAQGASLDGAPALQGLGFRDEERAVLRAQLRGVLVKLNFCDSLLTPVPSEGLAFSIEVHAHGAAGGTATSEELREQWVECAQPEVGCVGEPQQLVPFKAASAPELALQLFVMESPNKLQASQGFG